MITVDMRMHSGLDAPLWNPGTATTSRKGLWSRTILLLRLCVFGSCMLSANVVSGVYPAASYSEIKAEQGEVRAVAIIRHLPPGDCRYAEKMMWGAGGKCPETTLARLFIECSGEEVFVRRSAYADLSNVESVEVSRDAGDGHYVVTVRGGKSDAAYIASLDIISFDGIFGVEDVWNVREVRQRIIVKRDSPDKVWERARYTYGEIVQVRESCNS